MRFHGMIHHGGTGTISQLSHVPSYGVRWERAVVNDSH